MHDMFLKGLCMANATNFVIYLESIIAEVKVVIET